MNDYTYSQVRVPRESYVGRNHTAFSRWKSLAYADLPPRVALYIILLVQVTPCSAQLPLQGYASNDAMQRYTNASIFVSMDPT